MHFKLDLKEKKTLMKKKKSGENGTFLKSDLYLALFLLFWRMGHFCLQHLWIDGRLEKCFREANLECL